MNNTDILTAEKLAELKKKPIDFSDIPELTEDEALELKLKNQHIESN
jgi:hypothetical protein